MDITIKLPLHAVRLLAQMCREMRSQLSRMDTNDGLSLQSVAMADSLNAIEFEIPANIWKETGE